MNAFLLTGRTDKFMEVRLLETKVNEIYTKLGIENKNVYTLRHSFATRFYNATNDIKTLSELLGHADIKTTYRYIYTDDSRKRQGVNSLVFNRM
jgi:site-specific recombinase XerD